METLITGAAPTEREPLRLEVREGIQGRWQGQRGRASFGAAHLAGGVAGVSTARCPQRIVRRLRRPVHGLAARFSPSESQRTRYSYASTQGSLNDQYAPRRLGRTGINVPR